jgi:hypothetical protein
MDDETRIRHLSHAANAMLSEATKVKNHLRQRIGKGDGFIDECMERDCKLLELREAEFRKLVPHGFK